MSRELTPESVALLSHKLPLDVRQGLAIRVTERYENPELSDKERQVAQEIFRLLARDADETVRVILAENLKNDPTLPHDVALTLARDVAENVAVPMLEASELLTDSDLADILRSTRHLACKVAVARRPTVSETLSQALVETGEAAVVATLVENENAAMSDQTALTIVTHYREEASILEGMVNRSGLSATVAEKMLSLVSDRLRASLVARHNISPYMLEEAVEKSRETTTIGLLDPAGTADVEKLVESMHAARRLTPSIIIRALCMGNLRFFEAGMARCASIPLENARKLMLDAGPLGFRALYKAAGMPPGMFEATRVLLTLIRQETSAGGARPYNFHTRIMERILEGRYDTEVENMPYLMAILGRSISRIHRPSQITGGSITDAGRVSA